MSKTARTPQVPGEPINQDPIAEAVEQAGEAAELEVPRIAEEPAVVLPKVADIDQAAIKQPVLTEEGWLVPSTPLPGGGR